jgi:hypothetical protein
MKSLLSTSLIFAAMTLTIASPMNFKRASTNQGPIAIPLKRNNVGAPDAKSGFKGLAVNPAPLNTLIDPTNNQIFLVGNHTEELLLVSKFSLTSSHDADLDVLHYCFHMTP